MSGRDPSIVHCSIRPTRRLRVVCAQFGLVVVHRGAQEKRRAAGRGRRRVSAVQRARSDRALVDARRAARAIDLRLAYGAVALVTGPSGSGKTRLMRELARRLRMSGRTVIIAGRGHSHRSRSRRSILDELAGMCGSAESALSVLAWAGLADAKLLARRACELSEGQGHRYAVARAMARAGQLSRGRAGGITVLIDEFASTLDRVTARGLAATVRRWVQDRGDVRLVCATAHDDVMEWLGPSLLVYQPAEGLAELHEKSRKPQMDPDEPR